MDAASINAVLEALKQKSPDIIERTGLVPFAAVPNGFTLTSLAQFNHEPERVKQAVTLLTAADLVGYFCRFKNPSSAIFADERTAKYVAVIDYHDADGKPHWSSHTASYSCPKAKEWDIWSAANGKRMPQSDFAVFLEDNYIDIIEPSSAEMIEVATSLEAKKSVQFKSAVRMSNGQTDFTYTENIDGNARGGQLKIPEKFRIEIPVFLSGPRYSIDARLRYRIGDGGALQIWFDLHRAHSIVEAATQDITKAIRAGIGESPMYLGAAEGVR